MVPEAGTVCFETPLYQQIATMATAFRAGPLARFSHRSPAQVNKSCAELGFSKLAIADDACVKNMSIYTKQTLDVNQTLTELRAQNKGEMQTFADRRGISYKNSEKWAMCSGGCEEGSQDGFKWWGADKKYSQFDCMIAVPMILPNLRKHTSKIGSFVVDSGLLCWEGAFDYMEQTLAGVKRTPGGDLFKNATVKELTCGDLGYDSTRDPRDECWTDATKVARSKHEMDDMVAWAIGENSLKEMMPASDTARGYPEGTSLDLFSCQCQHGGAARDRGMWLTMKNEMVDSRYSDEFCKDLNSRYLKKGKKNKVKTVKKTRR